MLQQRAGRIHSKSSQSTDIILTNDGIRRRRGTGNSEAIMVSVWWIGKHEAISVPFSSFIRVSQQVAHAFDHKNSQCKMGLLPRVLGYTFQAGSTKVNLQTIYLAFALSFGKERVYPFCFGLVGARPRDIHSLSARSRPGQHIVFSIIGCL